MADWIFVLIYMLGGLAVLLLIGLPVAFAFLAVTLVGAYHVLGGDAGLIQLTRNTVKTLANFQLAPIPLFILMGEVLFQTGIAQRAINAIDLLITKMPGRLSVVTVFGGTIFAALSGSTIANTAMLGSTLLPNMLNKGYHPTLAMGPIMASGAIAMLIPPSALAVLVASLAGMSISKLLLAGVVPALILALCFVIYVITRSLLQPEVAPHDELPPLSLGQRWKPFLIHVLPLSGLFIIVIGSLFAGLATPTESAAFGCVGAVLTGLAYRSLSRAALGKALMETVKLSVMILLIIATSQTFAQILSFSGATHGLISMIEAFSLAPLAILLGMIIILLILGCFIDQVSMLMVTVPIFVPLAQAAQINDLVLGVVYLLTMEIGLLTPPFGLLLFVMQGVAPPTIHMATIYRSVLPFLFIKIFVLCLILFIPQLATWLPSLIIEK